MPRDGTHPQHDAASWDPLSLATVIAQAHVAATERDFGYAFRLLATAQAFAPKTPWADVPWVTGSGQLILPPLRPR